jgi:hypothetical protein
MFIKIASKLFKGRGEKVNCLRVCGPRICHACSMFIEICWRVVQAILKYYWRMFNVIVMKSPMNYISLIYCSLTTGNMVNTIAHQRTILKGKNLVEVLG